jgi:hypothetical protein
MLAKIYVHGSKEQNADTGRQLGLTGEALNNFKYAAYEVELEYEVDPATGEAELLKVDGRELK